MSVVITLKTAHSIQWQVHFLKKKYKPSEESLLLCECTLVFLHVLFVSFSLFVFSYFNLETVELQVANELIELVSLSATLLKAKCHDTVAALLMAG